MIDDVMTDRLMYDREHRMNSKLISDNSMLRAIHQDDKARIARLEQAIRDLLIRIDLNGGIGEYKGGPAFAVKRARDLVTGINTGGERD